MLRRALLSFALFTAVTAIAPSAQACPMCKVANEEAENTEAAAVANARPRAYMYSILFMLSMPATLTASFGLGFYRLHKRQQALLAAEGDVDNSLDVFPEPTPA